MRKQKESGPAGIRQIAEALGVSIGTVDRALHGREGVSAKTRERVLRQAKKLNYTPNLVARNLKLNRHFRIGVFLPEQIASFFDPLRAGIRAGALAAAGANVEVVFHSYPQLGQGDVESMETHRWRQFDGIILAPGQPAKVTFICQEAEEENKPIVFVATDAARENRLASIAVESVLSGGIAAELLGRLVPDRRQVVVITGDLKIQDHADKLRGFAASLATLAPHLTMLPAIQSHESARDAHKATSRLLKEHPDLGAIYISTANSAPVIAAVAESQRAGKVQIIATDFFPEMAQWIESGQVFAALHQRPFTQGRMAFEALSRFLVQGCAPERSVRLAPHLVLRSNMSLFVDAYSAGRPEPEF
ncbi:LacI family DNA-binding transcriptional regulator [Occallatibacter riparius]|uniref:LacI family DNA-binding transcriptional regulator n=1 Tax=Occallatibacter riparius TaxID=1002689 RepID=A0A9J7BVY6_9BACT|nr:LacI family DNA-binding transcriptional regulator [Occallatibacter riparius]UWZ86800.1 LacI family DNA-binding transcriptional regulator [Occallatibacter riparius]